MNGSSPVCTEDRGWKLELGGYCRPQDQDTNGNKWAKPCLHLNG
jgi:hypothetical protein